MSVQYNKNLIIAVEYSFQILYMEVYDGFEKCIVHMKLGPAPRRDRPHHRGAAGAETGRFQRRSIIHLGNMPSRNASICHPPS